MEESQHIPLSLKYQLIVEQVEYQGEGELFLKKLEERKKFIEEGLFDSDKKKQTLQNTKKILELLHLKQELFLGIFCIELMIDFQLT